MHIPLKGNAFAVLQEEKKVFRRKEKKEKAILKKERQKLMADFESTKSPELAPQSTQLDPAASTTLNWADVRDDDDEDEEKPCSDFVYSNQYSDIQIDQHHGISKEDLDHLDEDDLDDEEEDEELDNEDTNGPHQFPLADTNQHTPANFLDTVTKHLVPPTRCTKSPINPQQLSKKERQRVHTQELEELDILLKGMIKPLSNNNVSNDHLPPSRDPESAGHLPAVSATCQKQECEPPESLEHQIHDPEAEETVPTKPKPKKKKKNSAQASATTVLNEPATVPSPQPSIPPKDALVAARKAAGGRKKPQTTSLNPNVLDSVIAEAKKKSELKKAKKKKEKRFHER